MNAILKEQILSGDYGFDYKQSFSRNIGWVTEAEQKQIRKTKVAIGGLGGVGGSHLKALVRMGFEYFNIADLDDFDYSNFMHNSFCEGHPDRSEENINGYHKQIALLINLFLKHRYSDYKEYLDDLDDFKKIEKI